MYPHTFVALLKDWLTAAGHPGIALVRTCAELGRWEQPGGVAVALTDGWTFILQTVGTAPPGGNANRNPNSPAPARFDGEWYDRPDYLAARAVFEKEAASYNGPRSRRPQATATALLGVALEVVKRAEHPEIASVELGVTKWTGRQVLRVVCDDGSRVLGLPAGFIAPGSPELAHPAHDIPKEWIGSCVPNATSTPASNPESPAASTRSGTAANGAPDRANQQSKGRAKTRRSQRGPSTSKEEN